MWILLACFSALFAGLTSILAKCGLKKTDPDVATVIRTAVALVFSWVVVFVSGSLSTIGEISRKSFLFLILSGLATGASWLCYFKALAMGDINKVIPLDKSSTVLSILFAIIILGETDHLAVRLPGTALIAVGTYLMIEHKDVQEKEERRGWFLYASLSALFAALTSILAKVGMDTVEPDLATAIRTCVVLGMAWVLLLVKGKHRDIMRVDRIETVFLFFSGVATGASWLCYYTAIQKGIVGIVVPVDKLSILVTVIFSLVVFKEKLSVKAAFGLFCIVVGTLGMAVFL